ncbi:unnamed protein product [Prunus armeniaca]
MEGGLGFRDLLDFNIALLGKQCWRLIHNPNSLWAKTLKARYFPKVEFWNAKVGHRSSWLWASLIAGRDEVLKHARAQILSGETTHIWTDRWLPPPYEGTINPIRPVPHDAPQFVAEIMDKDLHQWNLQRILHLLDQDSINKILCLPIGNVNNPDRIVWPWCTNGLYSAKSGYHLIHALRNVPPSNGGQSSHCVNPLVWKETWKINTLPKFKVFCWKIISKALATRLNLYKRKLNVNMICPLCNDQVESEEHLFFLCPWVKMVWFCSTFNYRVNTRSFTTFDQWVESLVQMKFPSFLDKRNFLTNLIWFIWKVRCQFIFYGCKHEPTRVLQMANSMVGDFLEAYLPSNSIVITHREVLPTQPHWTPPRTGWVKVNSDGAWKTNKAAGLGVIIRNSAGAFSGGLAEGKVCQSAIAAEADAVLSGLKLAPSLRHRKVMKKTDSLVVKSGIAENYGNRAWSILPILLEIRRMEGLFDSVEWSWIPRVKNRAAHMAASIRIGAVHRETCLNQPPPSLVRVLSSDGLPCPPAM